MWLVENVLFEQKTSQSNSALWPAVTSEDPNQSYNHWSKSHSLSPQANPYLPPATDILNTHPFFGLRKQCPGWVVSVHGPVGVYESIFGDVLRCEEGGGMTETGTEIHTKWPRAASTYKIQHGGEVEFVEQKMILSPHFNRSSTYLMYHWDSSLSSNYK